MIRKSKEFYQLDLLPQFPGLEQTAATIMMIITITTAAIAPIILKC